MSHLLSVDPGSTLAYHTGDWRIQRPVYHNKWPPCGQTCPAGEDIQAYLALINDQQWEAAWHQLTQANPLPAVMGRICYHPCELGCNRKHLDSAVNIHAVERYLGDLALQRGWCHQPLSTQQQTQQVAVIGAGPAGLSCAFQLARRGYPVTIFDAQAAPGGTMYNAIPEYRLPKSVLSQEIAAILALGIQLRLNTRVGLDVSVEALREEFSAIFVAIGAQQPRIYRDDKHPTQHSVMTGLDFLRRVNQGEMASLPKQVAVVGGGNTAMDAARCARRLGAEKVTVICPQQPHGHHHGQAGTEIPASAQEVAEAESDGVVILYRHGVRRLVRSGEHLSGLELAQVDQVHDRHGRFNPKLFDGTETFLPADRVIFAIGQEVDCNGLDALLQPEVPGVWMGGDAAGKPRNVATAVGSGHQVAASMIAFLGNTTSFDEHHQKAEITFKDLNINYYPKLTRREAVSENQVLGFQTSVPSLSTDDALFEAGRCLSCGVCFECDNCWHFCPDAAVIKHAEKYSIDYDYCKGCGICAQECPCGHIDMIRD